MPHLFEKLTPDVVIDALEATGLLLDGRLMTLSSYENRVYLAHTDDGAGVVAKFYRPERWSDAQIQEEHDFAAQLVAAEIPLAAPIAFNGATLHHAHGFRYSVSPRKGGRRPELDDLDTLEWIGRFLARMHTVGAAQSFAVRPALNIATFGTEPERAQLGMDAVVTFDQPMINNWTVQQRAIAAKLTAMKEELSPPYRHVPLPRVLHPEVLFG